MTSDRRHSRGGAASGHGARSGAGQIRPDDTPDDAPPADAGRGDEDEQAFARSGQFTGRRIPQQEPDQAAAEDAYRRAAAASPAADNDDQPHVNAAAGLGATAGNEDAQALARERDQYRADLQRLAADFDNFRKRAVREREQAAQAADARLLGELLAVLDDFERALEHAGDESAGQLAEGIRMTHSRLMGVLGQHGLQAIDAAGEQFDPHLHEAMMMQPAPEGVEPGTILQVVQKGYLLGDRPLRHARVIVAGEA